MDGNETIGLNNLTIGGAPQIISGGVDLSDAGVDDTVGELLGTMN